MDCKTFLRQLYIGSGAWSIYFIQGLCTGFPAVLVPQLRKANQTITLEQSSWLPALHAYSGLPWVVLLPILITVIGRKKSHIIVSCCSLFGFIIFYFSTNITHFMVGEIIFGACAASYLTTNVAILTEYVSSKNRGIFLSIKTVSFYWGILASNTIGTFFHWQYITILGLICALYSLLNVIIWPESPLWLASKGRFVECAASHRWLRGISEDSEKELDQLLKSHNNRQFVKQQWSVRYVYKTISCKYFYKPILLSIVLVCTYCVSGKLVCVVYAIDILKKISSSESTAYSGMLILDGITIASMYLGCLITKFLKRRVNLISFSVAGIVNMILISIYLYLAKLTLISENKHVSLFLLASYSITISSGPMVLCTSLISELLPVESRMLTMCIIGLLFIATYGTFFKIAPLCFENLEMHGTFLLFAILSIMCIILIYFYLPETKDKTILQIDQCLKEGKSETNEENAELMNLNTKTCTLAGGVSP